MGFFIAQFLAGLAAASSLFLVSAGLSLIFGVTRIVNFAHGSFYMLGAYMAYSLTAHMQGMFGFWGGVVLAALAVGVVGVLLEVLVLRRLYRSPELFQLLATFAIVLVIQDVTLALWGPDDLLGPLAPGLQGSFTLLGQRIPEYDVALIVIGPGVLGGLWLVLHRTRFGILVRAATTDGDMAQALGIDKRLLFSAVFFVGAALAGLGGALQLPREPANLLMDLNIIVEAFVVVVIGGLGSVGGAFLAALLIGELQAFGIVLVPEITLVLLFLVMAVVLVVRPWGLLGRPETGAAHAHAPLPGIRRPHGWGWLVLLAALAGVPLLFGEYGTGVAAEILVFTLFATSLHFIMGAGGMVSFGHAAYLGLGAYGAALMVTQAGASMVAALLAATVAGGVGALVFGWFCVRLSGVYLAMLTLAFAQIAYSVVFQWYGVTGGDNGLLGIWPPRWAGGEVYYGLVLGLVALALAGLVHVVFAPFGMGLRAARDEALRAEASGIHVGRIRWLAFGLAGAAAGLAGGLYAFLKGSVFPDTISIPVSVDGLVMVLLGGAQTVLGPLAGAPLLVGLRISIASETDLWRGILGIIIIVLVMAFPDGVVGRLRSWRLKSWRRTGGQGR